MSETTNTTKQFLDKDGLNALWDKICSVFASKQELEDLGNGITVIDEKVKNEAITDNTNPYFLLCQSSQNTTGKAGTDENCYIKEGSIYSSCNKVLTEANLEDSEPVQRNDNTWSNVKFDTDGFMGVDVPTIPTVNNGTLTIKQNGIEVGTFTANQSGDVTIELTDTNTDTQSDWNVTNTSSAAYIKNKPTIPSVGNGTITITQNGVEKGSFTVNQTTNTTIALTDNSGEMNVQSDWNETNTTSDAFIKNKPDLVTTASDGLVPKADAAAGTINSSTTDWVLTNDNGTIGWYKLPANAFNNTNTVTPQAIGSCSVAANSVVKNMTFSQSIGTWYNLGNIIYLKFTNGNTAVGTSANPFILTDTRGGTILNVLYKNLPITASNPFNIPAGTVVCFAVTQSTTSSSSPGTAEVIGIYDENSGSDYLPLSGGTLTGQLNSRSIVPTSTNTYNLGTDSLKWANILATNTKTDKVYTDRVDYNSWSITNASTEPNLFKAAIEPTSTANLCTQKIFRFSEGSSVAYGNCNINQNYAATNMWVAGDTFGYISIPYNPSGSSSIYIGGGNRGGTSWSAKLFNDSMSCIPSATNTYSLGSSSIKWSNVYATTFNGNLTGNVTGNLTGNVTGNVTGSSGSCTGNAATATSATSATNASNIYINTSTASAYYPMTFVTTASAGNTKLYIGDSTGTTSTGAGIRYNPSAKTCYCSGGFYEASDERLKNFSNDIEVDLDKLSKLSKKYFTWKDDESNAQHIGVSAQEVQGLYPELVEVIDEEGHLSVSYDKLSVVALKGIDILNDKIKSLEDRLSNLEQLIENKF